MTKEFKRKFWLWLPVILQMGIIFYFSSQPAGSESLERFPLPAGIGHFGGYGLLGLLLYRAIAGGWKVWDLQAAYRTLLIAAGYGIWDEFYQSFIPGREPTLIDVIIDVAGASASLLAIRLWIWLRSMGRETPN